MPGEGALAERARQAAEAPLPSAFVRPHRWMRALLALSIVSTPVLAACEEDPEPAFVSSGRERRSADTERGERDETERRTAEPEPARPSSIPAPPDVAAPPDDAERTASGLASKVLQPGTGTVHPGPRDGVTVHYTGWRAENGEMFDSSVPRGAPATFTLDRVIAGWTEGLQLMVAGEKRRLWIPANLAYEGRPGRPQGMLVFDVELLDIWPLDAPANVSAPPANAERSPSGLAWIVLEPGSGTRRPTATDTVEAHYVGWRAENGERFDTSITRGRPLRIPVSGVIPGWQEGLQLMVEGEKRRFWIPANLAYEGRPGPQGMLVFDVALLRIL